MQDRTHNGVAFRILNVTDEYTRECSLTLVARQLNHTDVLTCAQLAPSLARCACSYSI